MTFKVWFLYGNDTKESEQHWVIVQAKNAHLASIKAMHVILPMADDGAVVQKVEVIK